MEAFARVYCRTNTKVATEQLGRRVSSEADSGPVFESVPGNFGAVSVAEIESSDHRLG